MLLLWDIMCCVDSTDLTIFAAQKYVNKVDKILETPLWKLKWK